MHLENMYRNGATEAEMVKAVGTCGTEFEAATAKQHADNLIVKLQDQIEALKRVKVVAGERYDEFQKAPRKCYVLYESQNYGQAEYGVALLSVPENTTSMHWYIDREMGSLRYMKHNPLSGEKHVHPWVVEDTIRTYIGGEHRKEATAYAKELAAKHKCEIIRKDSR